MGQTTFSGPVKSGTIKETTGTTVGDDMKNTGDVVLSQTATVDYTDTSAKDLFVIPANSQILEFTVDVTTAFDSSGTDLLDIGKTGALNHFADNLDVSSVARLLGSSDASQLANYVDVGTSDIQVTGLYAQSVADATAGEARITVTYVQGNNLS